MPRPTPYLLRWSSARQRYELCESRDHAVLGLEVESPAWFTWVNQVPSFAFHGRMGSYTARREPKVHGGGYWYAYLREKDKVTKRYLGRSVDLTLTRLEQTARLFAEHPSEAPPLSQGTTEQQVVSTSLSTSTPQATPDEQEAPMSTWLQREPLLATKVHVPRLRSASVHRPQLIERLQQGMEGVCTLLSAPAGFGKTTLLAEWFSASKTPIAWLSLEQEDNEPIRFLSYIIAALQTLDPAIGVSALALLHTPQPAELQTVLTVLTNDLMLRVNAPFALVLDDYHIITAESIHHALAFLLQHLPPQMHLIIATRADPSLPLTRLRARGQLTEVRAADLRFATQEAETFLRTVMRLELSPDQIAVLQRRTEGWIAGLQFAALSLQGRTDTSSFLTAFTGSHRFVLDYLSEEVFALQSPQVQSFLLQTCILERMCGPLCESVTEEMGGQAMLEHLERTNLFLTSLDGERHWYRYHHLFAEVLRNNLQRSQPSLVATLHSRAAAWYDQHDLIEEALGHAFAGADLPFAVRIIEKHGQSLVGRGDIHTLRRWLSRLPHEVVRTHAQLCLYQAIVGVANRQFQTVRIWVQEAERLLSAMDASHQRPDLQDMHGQAFAVRAIIASIEGDLSRTTTLSQQALAHLSTDSILFRSAVVRILGDAYRLSGDLGAARQAYRDAIATAPRVGSFHTFLLASRDDANVSLLQGKLHEAEQTYRRAFALAQERGWSSASAMGAAYLGLGEILYERNELEAALEHVQEGLDRCLQWGVQESIVEGHIALARLRQAQADERGAQAAMQQAAQLAAQYRIRPWTVTHLANCQVWLWLTQGKVQAATQWVQEQRLPREVIAAKHEEEYLALARVLIATKQLQEARHVLSSLLPPLEAMGTRRWLLEALLLSALAHASQQHLTQAHPFLERALLLAEPEGYIRLFLDEGTPMLNLLRQVRSGGLASNYISTLLSASGERATSAAPGSVPRSSLLVEVLSQRELEVLRLLAGGASNEEIAEQLVIAIGTVKRHVSNIFGKFTVSNRTQAVARARELGLL